eukprot:g7610.t1
MMVDSTYHASAGPVTANPRRRGGICYSSSSAEARWAAEAAAEACRQKKEQADRREAEVGAEMLRMMKMWSFEEAPAVAGGVSGVAAIAGGD